MIRVALYGLGGVVAGVVVTAFTLWLVWSRP